MRVLIAVPTYETIFPDTYKAIWDMEKGEHEVLFESVRGYDCATARNRIVLMAQELKVDYVMMIDNDVTPPKGALLDLMSHDVDVVSGYYAHRDADNIYRGRTCVCKLYAADGTKYYNYPLESEYTADELHRYQADGENLIQIHGGGMGCILIKMGVFEKIDYPWYDWINYAHGGMLSEDLHFCEQCRKKGIPLFVDPRVGCGHLLRHIQEV